MLMTVTWEGLWDWQGPARVPIQCVPVPSIAAGLDRPPGDRTGLVQGEARGRGAGPRQVRRKCLGSGGGAPASGAQCSHTTCVMVLPWAGSDKVRRNFGNCLPFLKHLQFPRAFTGSSVNSPSSKIRN